MADPKMKRCRACGKDYEVGKACAACGWDEEAEQVAAKRRRLERDVEKEQEEEAKPKPEEKPPLLPFGRPRK